MFKTRLLSGIVLVAVALLTIISGGYVLFFTLLGISLIGMQELYKAMKVRTDQFNALEIAGYLGAVIYYVLMAADFEKYGMMGVIIAFMIFMFVYVFNYPRFHAEQVMPAFFGVVYVAVMLSFIYLTRNLPDGKFLVWLIFLCSWGCDTCAYCVGMLIGKHKMAPVLSPKKSVEGGIGGVASLPQYRRAGGIRACFQKALPILYREGYVFSYLYPFSTAYYRKFGYESCVQRYLAVLDLRQPRPAEFSGSFRLARGGDMLLPAIRQLDERWEAQYNMMVQHAEADYRWLLSAAPASKQEFIYAAFSAAGEPLGYAAFKKQDEPNGRNLVCSRLRFSGKDGFAALMHLFSRFASDHRFVKFPLPCCTAMQYLLPEWSLGAVRWELQSAGMVRVVNAEAALRAARYLGGGSATLRLHDAQIEENNACFAVQFENGRAISVSRSDTQPDAELEISTFSALLCGVCDFSEARQYFPGLEVFHESAPLDRVFFRKPLYIEDYF